MYTPLWPYTKTGGHLGFWSLLGQKDWLFIFINSCFSHLQSNYCFLFSSFIGYIKNGGRGRWLYNIRFLSWFWVWHIISSLRKAGMGWLSFWGCPFSICTNTHVWICSCVCHQSNNLPASISSGSTFIIIFTISEDCHTIMTPN